MRRLCRRFRRATMLAALLLAQNSHAQAPDVHLSGFATLGAAVSDRDDMWFYRSGLNKPGSDRVDLGSDTLLGLQGSLKLGDSGDLTVQLLSRENTRGNYDPRIAWAFWRYDVSPALSIRLGRLRVPFFMLSDSLNVNYANPWVRPPEEVYSLNPFSELDGIDLLLRLPAGRLELELQPYFGAGRIKLINGGTAELRDVRGLNLALIGERFSVHLGHGSGRLAVDWGDPGFRALSTALRDAGGDLVTLAERLAGRKGQASFSSAGFQWDNGRQLLIGEIVRRRADRYVNSAHAWYLTAGQRIGAFTPYVGYARQRQDRPVAHATIAHPGLAAGFEAFNVSRNDAQRSITLGTRWDFARNAALKAELSRSRVARDAWGSYFPRDAGGTQPGGRTAHLLSISLDVVF